MTPDKVWWICSGTVPMELKVADGLIPQIPTIQQFQTIPNNLKDLEHDVKC